MTAAGPATDLTHVEDVKDVIVVGDGPAGLALGAACVAEELDVLVIGSERPWTATYATWVDDVPGHVPALGVRTRVDVVASTRRPLDREYAVFDNDRLRGMLDRAPQANGDAVGVEADDGGCAVLTADGERRRARLVVDATGSQPVLLESPARRRGRTTVQSAYGLVLAERPGVLEGERGVLMDWRQPVDGRDPTFLYVVPLPDGTWLVEETSLARTPPLTADELRRRLAVRLGGDCTNDAVRIEHVLIPMATGVPRRSQRVVGFGAAAGYVHPATGYSVAASLRAAPRVAAGIASALGGTDDPRALSLAAWNAVWPGEQRRARALHDYGLAAIRRMRPEEIRLFFEAFFALPVEGWAGYLRVDTTAGEVGRVMRAVFSAVPWQVRRRLALGSPLPFGDLLR